ncbi:MAG TPA: nucleotidyltransferase family protein [Actinomycetota bacterium]
MIDPLDMTAVRKLSSPTLSGPALEAAHRLLSAPSPDAELDRLYPLLVEHHVAPAILETLCGAGGELAELSVARELVATLWPFNRLLPELVENPPGRIPLSELALAMQRHTAHLDAVVQGLSDRGLAERFVLLFGGALRLVAPRYPRLSNDLDVYTPGAAGGVALVRELWDRWGFVLVRLRTSRFDGQGLGHLKLLRTTDDGHQLHVDVIAGGRPARRGLVPAFVEPALFERSRVMTLEGRHVRVPSSEDMLVWLAEKVVRRGHLRLRDVHDAWVLASNGSGGTDWSYVLEASARHGLLGILSRLLAVAERVNGHIAIEPDVRLAMRPGPLMRRLLRGPVSPAWRRAWIVAMLARGLAHPGVYREIAAGGLRAKVLKESSRVAQRAVARDLRRLHGGAGNQHLTIGWFPNPKQAVRRSPEA